MTDIYTEGKIKPAVVGGKVADTEDLAGAFVKSVTEAGVVTLQMADDSERIVTLEREVVLENRDPDAADFAARRLFYDGIELRKIIRVPVPGHDRVVGFTEDDLDIALLGTGIYADRNAASAANPFATRPTGLRYFNRSLARWELWQVGQYWDTRRSVAEPQSAEGSLWIDEWPTEAAASPHASRVGQITSYPNDDGEYVLHRVASIVLGVEDGFRYELGPVYSTYKLGNADIDDAESNVQGTVSGRGIARGVQAHERFTDVEQGVLDDLSRQTFPHPTDDWQIRQTYAVHDFFTDRASVFLSLGWDADNRLRALSADGHVGRLGRHDQGRIYDGPETLRAGLISGVHWLFLRDEAGGSVIERAPVDGGDDDTEFQIVLRYFSLFADPDSGTLLGILRRISSEEMEVGLLAYDAAAGTITAEDTITVTRAHLDAALGADYAALPDIHRESATGVYQEVSGAILEGDTLYLLLTDIARTDGHTASVLVGFTLAGTPNNRTLTVLAENAVTELPVSDELTSGILPLEADELFLARDTAVYRLSPQSDGGLVDKADKDLGNVDGDLTIAERQAVREKLAAASQTDLTAAGNAIEANIAAAAAAANAAAAASAQAAAAANSPALSDDAPENIGPTASPGVAAAAIRKDHIHALPTDATLEFDSVSGDLGVSIHDVIEHTQERITYHTDATVYPHGGGATVGQIYTTSAFRKTIIKVEVDIDPETGGATEYEVRLDRVHENRNIAEKLAVSQSISVMGAPGRRTFNFTHANGEVGIPIDPSIRLGVLCSRIGDGHDAGAYLRYGEEAPGSPNESYDDASADFNLVGGVVYRVENPEVGQSTHSHQDDQTVGGQIWGNIRITYRLTYDHGTLIGDGKADTDLQNIDEDLSDAEKEAIRIRIGATAGGGSAAAPVILYDNTDGVALSQGTSAGTWAQSYDLDLGLALVEADDDKDLNVRYSFVRQGVIRRRNFTLKAGAFRVMPAFNDVAGSLIPDDSFWFLALDGRYSGIDGGFGAADISVFTRMGLLTRNRVAGNDIMRLVFPVANDVIEATTEARFVVELATPAGGSAQQQSGESGRILRTRSVVAADTLIAANNYNFDLSVNGQIALGRYALNPTPRSDIFDFVATIRVGGRGGIPIRLSREQFDYVGEYDLQDTWPFGGSGGGAWGNVTEIPCAMLYVNHRSEGIVKTQLKPQRQQIGWSMSDPEPATTVLFFFSYNSSGNVDFVEMIVFTDQVVEIEGVHFHYWENA